MHDDGAATVRSSISEMVKGRRKGVRLVCEKEERGNTYGCYSVHKCFFSTCNLNYLISFCHMSYINALNMYKLRHPKWSKVELGQVRVEW